MGPLMLILCFATGCLLAVGVVPVAHALSRQLAGGRQRQFHQAPGEAVTRLGGLCLVASLLGTLIVESLLTPHGGLLDAPYPAIIVTALAMFAMGFWDDIRPLGARRKLILQVAIAATAWAWGIRVELYKSLLFTGTSREWGPWSLPVTVVWLVALTNLINLIDGIDGLAAGIGLMMMTLLACVGFEAGQYLSALVATGMAGALLGFLYFNFPPATIYLGDGGAYFLGFLIGALSVANSHKATVAAALIAPIFALGLPIVDVFLAILRRGLNGLPIFRADRKHLHHRLLESGLSRRRTVLLLYLVSLVCLAAAFGVFWSQGRLVPLLLGFLFLALLATSRSFSFRREWFALGRLVGNSLEMRRETRYALALTNWFELEAERCRSGEDLWRSYTFLVGSLQLARVSLRGVAQEHDWRAVTTDETAPPRTACFDLTGGASLHLWAAESLPERRFELDAELAAEAWARGFERWRELSRQT